MDKAAGVYNLMKEDLKSKNRGRASSVSVMERWMTKNDKKETKREKEERLDGIKRSEKANRSPSKCAWRSNIEKREFEKRSEEDADGAVWQILRELKGIRVDMENGREEMKKEIRKLENNILHTEERWAAREAVMIKNIEELENRVKILKRKEDKLNEDIRGNVTKSMVEVKERTAIEMCDGNVMRQHMEETKKELNLLKRKIDEGNYAD